MEKHPDHHRPLRLLLVEDDASDILLFKHNIVDTDLEISKLQTASTLADAKQLLHQHDFDAILLDLHLPDSDGIETLRKMVPCAGLIPIIVQTGLFDEEMAMQALSEGAFDYLLKGEYTPQLLSFSIRFSCERTRAMELQREKDRIEKIRQEFMAIATHDIKSPLATIRGFAALLEKRFPEGSIMTLDGAHCIQRIHNQSKVMQNLIEDFLDFQALEEGMLKMHKHPSDLNELAIKIVESYTNHAKKKNCELKFIPEENLPKIPIDNTRIDQVIRNFVSNAIKFGFPGNEVVVKTQNNQNHILLQVTDSGPGLSPEDLKRAFGKYQQLSNMPTGGEKSSGLGLAICKQLIELHGGCIGAKNNEGELSGSTFWFNLPTEPHS